MEATAAAQAAEALAVHREVAAKFEAEAMATSLKVAELVLASLAFFSCSTVAQGLIQSLSDLSDSGEARSSLVR